MKSEIKNSDIRMVLFDVDGVMTNGTIYINEIGEFFKSFNVKDGLAIELLRCHGLITGVISGKSSEALSVRCRQLGFDEVITDCKNKLPALMELCDKYDLGAHQVAFVGDDVLDIPIFDIAALSVAPSDAHELAMQAADWVMSSKGGDGVVREFADKLLQSQLGISLADVYKPLLSKIKSDDTSSIEQ